MNFLRRHPRLIGPILVALSIAVTGLGLLALDLYYHHKHSKSAGTNYRGYRGEVLGKKGPNEFRIFVLGGSTAFGYGVGPDESIPAYLESIVQSRVSSEDKTVRVINLAYNNESAICFADTLKYYDYLEPDAVIFYSGYNDTPFTTLYRKADGCFRNKSWTFRTVGYLPILPLVATERYYILRYGSVGEGYRRIKAKPSTIKRAKPNEWETIHRYLNLVGGVARYLSWNSIGMIYVTQPYLSVDSYHFRQQRHIRAHFYQEPEMIYPKYPHNECRMCFKHVNLGDIFTQEKLKEYAYDGMHLTAEGNEAIAYALLEPTLWMIKTLRPEWNIIF
ncbi:hypothetical protein LCGC14_0517190 [marine sediment metagenome]|uniref:SGNH hydrolase-type esterase domain-containing protein n=1 Tax=marine sediment metagenome TaxID=412755 RepID=A0A0F9RZQ4_9ZZZZ